MSGKRDAPYVGIHAISALDDIAIRNYYLFHLTFKLVKQSEKGWIGLTSQPIALAATLISFLYSLIKPASATTVIIIYSAVMVSIIAALIVDRLKRRSGRVLDDQICLYILLDQVAKYTRQLKLILRILDTDDELTNVYVERNAMILKESLQRVYSFIENLRKARLYPDCLKGFGWSESFANEKIEEANMLLKELKRS